MLADALDMLREFFETAEPHECRKLWAVLTALRGPDNNDDEVKHQTTTHIRKKAFGPSIKKVESTCGIVVQDKPANWRSICDDSSAGPHFDSHVRQAARALGMLMDVEGFFNRQNY
jgi:hypothetical protein